MTDEPENGTLPLAEPLTAREQEVLSLLAQQRTNRQIADELVLAHSTVRWYLRQIYAKLGVAGRREAAARAQALGLAAAQQADEAAQSNLPVAATPFVGRQVELQALDDWLLDPNVRLVTIVGPGGMGKTRLALALAARQVARRVPGSDRLLFPDGVWHASMAQVEAAAQVVPALADAVGLEVEPAGSGRSPEEQVAGYLRRKRLLLLLDNFEHLLAAGPLLARLLGAAPHAKVLATSRQRLQLQGEQLFWIHGLAVSEEETGVAAARSAAVRLFAQTARRVNPAFTLEDGELGAVVRICQLLEGMPLAIELAASWAGVLSPAAIEAEMDRGLAILASDMRDVPRRHRSMQAALNGSWQQLDVEAREVLQRLTVFRGGFAREAAEQVAGATLPALMRLVNGSWLTHDQAGDRYQIHELLRQFGADRLQEQPVMQAAAHQSHAAFYCDFLGERQRTWYGGEAQAALATVERERANVRLAWQWAVAHGEVAMIGGALDSLGAYYDRRGDEDEARALLRAASESVSVALAQDEDNVAPRLLLARLLAWRSRFARSVEAARPMLAEAETLLAELRQESVDVRGEEAFLAFRCGEVEAQEDPLVARPHYERSLALYEELDDAVGRALVTTALGGVEWHLGHYQEAADLVRQGLAWHRAIRNRSGVPEALGALGLIEKHRGRMDQAENAHRESYRLFLELGSRADAAGTAAALALTHCWAGDYEAALAVANEALAPAEAIGSPTLSAFVAYAVAQSAIHLGLYDEARVQAERAMMLARSAGDRQTFGWALMYMGQVSLAWGSHEIAVAQLEEAAIALTEFRKSIWFLPLTFQALALGQLGDFPQARRVLAKALRENMQPRVFYVVVNALPAAAQLIAAQDHLEKALDLYALAKRYPCVANSRWFEDVVGGDVAGWAAALPPDVVGAARERGRARDLWETAEELIAEFGEDAP